MNPVKSSAEAVLGIVFIALIFFGGCALLAGLAMSLFLPSYLEFYRPWSFGFEIKGFQVITGIILLITSWVFYKLVKYYEDVCVDNPKKRRNFILVICSTLSIIVIGVFVLLGHNSINSTNDNSVARKKIADSLKNQNEIVWAIVTDNYLTEEHINTIEQNIKDAFANRNYPLNIELFKEPSLEIYSKDYKRDDDKRYNYKSELKKYLEKLVSEKMSLSENYYFVIVINSEFQTDWFSISPPFDIRHPRPFDPDPPRVELPKTCEIYAHLLIAKSNKVFQDIDITYINETEIKSIPIDIEDNERFKYLETEYLNLSFKDINWSNYLGNFVGFLQ